MTLMIQSFTPSGARKLTITSLIQNGCLFIDQPEMVKTFYKTTGVIDSHNKQHYDNIEIKHYLHTKCWWKRVCPSIFAICITVAMDVYQACMGDDIDTDLDKFSHW